MKTMATATKENTMSELVVSVNPFAENTTRRGRSWLCRVLYTFLDGCAIVEPLEECGTHGFVVRRGEYKEV